ncbi:MAG: YicC/YloC family endoribonuclease [Rhodothermales bacterium]
MISSMTGFGRGSAQRGGITATVEMRSVNNRFIDVVLRLPKDLVDHETDVQARIKQAFERGRINVQVEIEKETGAELPIQVNASAARAYLRLLEDLRHATGIEEPVQLEHLVRYSEVFTSAEADPETKEQMWEAVLAALDDAIAQMRTMRRQEGHALQTDLHARLDAIERELGRIEDRAPTRVQEAGERLKERLAELLTDDRIDEDRLTQEIAILADKLDINEECVRLHSHLQLFREALGRPEPVGRKLNFIMQEIHREVNTISSKANDVQIAHWAVSMKEEVEKIREQVQNVE